MCIFSARLAPRAAPVSETPVTRIPATEPFPAGTVGPKDVDFFKRLDKATPRTTFVATQSNLIRVIKYHALGGKTI